MYKLQRIEENGTTLTLEFPDDIDIWDMQVNLRCFLMGSSFVEKTVDLIIPLDEKPIGVSYED